jgi:hypothetical protein
MSKFEQLLDYLINEEMDKANELFHEIVVEKSRDIYENLISEEEDEEMDEAADEEMDEAADEEEMDESADEEMDESDEEMDESVDEEMDEAEDEDMDESDEELEDSYMMDGDDDDMGDMPPQDKTDDFGGDVEAGGEEEAIMDIKAAIDQLEAAFAELEAATGHGGGEMPADAEFGADDKTDEMMGVPAMENRRVTREYKEKVGNDWDKNSMKSQGQIVGANTGEKMPTAQEGRPPISSGKGKPTTGASAHNILGKSSTHAEDGTKPHGKVGGLVKQGGKFVGSGTHNVDGVESGVKTVKKQGSGYPGNNKSAGPVGSGTGDKAGQTSGADSAKSPLNGAPNRNA